MTGIPEQRDLLVIGGGPAGAATATDGPREADEQHALAAELVAEGAGREKEAGEDDHVGVDDPLQLAALGAD